MNPLILAGTLILGPADDLDASVDYERFTITLNPDGSRTLRTLTVSPRGDLIRDVNQMAGSDWRPIEGTSRLFHGGECKGTVVRRVIGNRLHSYAWVPGEPTDFAEFEAPPGMTLGFHPIMHEAWKMNFYDYARGGRQKILIFTVSRTWNGKTLGHGELIDTTQAEFMGRETIEVPGGTFDCERFSWWTSFNQELRIWRTGPHNMLVQLEVLEENRHVLYRLATLSETEIVVS